MFQFRAVGMGNRSITQSKRSLQKRLAASPACEAVEPRTYLTVSFGTPGSFSAQGATAPIFAGQLNGASKPLDLAFAVSGAIQVWADNSSGTFAMATSIPLPAGAAAGTPFLVGNFSGSGSNIVMISENAVTQDGVLTYVTSDGSSTFTAGVTTSITDNGMGFTPIFAATGDFNGDGKADIAVVGQAPGISTLVLAILLGNGDGTFAEAHDYSISSSNSLGNTANETVLTGDLGNGHTSIIVDDFAGVSIDVFTGNGDGSFNTDQSSILVATSLAAGDFTGNGKLDLAAANGNQLTILLGNGNGAFTSGSSSTLTNPITALTAADINGDGTPDLVTNSGLFLGNGDGTFQSTPISLPVTLGAGGSTVNNILSVDINGDGKPDIVGFDSSGNTIDTAINTSPGATTVTVASNSGPTASLGADDQFSATVSSLTAGTPTGTIGFFDNGSQIGTASLVGGMGTFDAGTGLALGAHSITATYSGDTTFNANTSAPFVLTVLPASMTTLSSNDNPALPGAAITFTATVAAVTAGSGMPTGDVDFIDGTTQLGSIVLNPSGVATFTISTLSQATHQITARYVGDTTFGPSSATLAQVVNQPTLVPTVISSTIPKAVVGGTKVHGNATILLTNETSATISGPVTINLFASANGTTANAPMLAVLPHKRLKVKAGKSLKLKLNVKALPTTLAFETYTLLATAIDPNGHSSSGTTGPDVVVAAPFVKLTASKISAVKPSPVAPGKKVAFSFSLANGGNVPTSGSAMIAVGLSTDGQTQAVALTTQSAKFVVKPGHPRKFVLHVTIPAGQAAGVFFPYLSITQNGSTATAVGTTMFSIG